MSDGIAGELADLACVVALVELRERDAHAGAMQQGGVVESRADGVEAVGRFSSASSSTGHFLARELVRDDPGFRAARDDGLHAVAFRERNRAANVGGASDVEDDASAVRYRRERLAARRMQQRVLVRARSVSAFRESPDRAASTAPARLPADSAFMSPPRLMNSERLPSSTAS